MWSVLFLALDSYRRCGEFFYLIDSLDMGEAISIRLSELLVSVPGSGRGPGIFKGESYLL